MIKRMALVKECRGFYPKIGNDCWLAENATLIGDLEMGDQCSVWYNAVIRADVNSIRIGNKVNVQDGAVLHCTFEKTKVEIGDNVSIGHNALIHGCKIESNVLIGMGAIVMDDCVIESNSIIAAGAVVTKNTVVPSGTVFGGMPAKKIKEVSKELLEGEINRIANNYIQYADWFKE